MGSVPEAVYGQCTPLRALEGSTQAGVLGPPRPGHPTLSEGL